MVAAAHALVGGGLAASVSNPNLAIVLATVSHPLLDLVPHWDFGYNWRKKGKLRFFSESVLDLGVGFGLSYLIFGQGLDFWYFSAVIFMSVVWDILEAPYWFLKWRFPPFSSVYNFQSGIQHKLKLPWGILTQVISVFLIIWVLQSWK